MEHTILVAFTVEGQSRVDAQEYLTTTLPSPALSDVRSWWIAEDDRIDGSDNDSAVFVSPGNQERAARLLYGFALTPRHNIVTRDSHFEGGVES